MRRPSLDDVTRGHVLLAVGTVAGAVGLLLVAAPGLVPGPVRRVQPSLDASTVFGAALVLAVVLVLVAVFRVVSRSSTPVDRSPISEDIPEQPTTSDTPTISSRAETAYERLLSGFERTGQRRRYVAMYGRRADHVKHVPSQVQSLLDELAATAADTYATAAGCDEETARRAVDAGEWTDDRIAAAFLARDPNVTPSFTKRERLFGWIAPRHTFEARLDRTLVEIEQHAGSFLTFEPEGALVEPELGSNGEWTDAHETPEQRESSGEEVIEG